MPRHSEFNREKTDCGFRPVTEHTELENELHEKAHIDYDRVAIVRYYLSKALVTSIVILTIFFYRFPTLQSLLSTKMPLFTKLALPSHQVAPLLHTLEPRLAVRL